jgi:IBR domain, a half RING-finger domain
MLKTMEFSTKDRTYCCNAECGRFLVRGQNTEPWEYCVHCQIKTCTMCKKANHYGTTPDDCGEDVGELEVKALGMQEGWQQCPECQNMVQLASGCFHITFVFLPSSSSFY